MNAIESLEILFVGVAGMAVAIGVSASALNALFHFVLERGQR